MNAAALRRGVRVALLLSTFGAAGYAIAMPLIGGAVSARLLLAGVALGGMADLLLQRRDRTGRITAVVAIGAVLVGLLAVDPPLLAWAVALFGAQWLLRALWLLRRPLAVLADAAAMLAAITIALAAGRYSGSLWLALWCLLLLQAIATAALLPAPSTLADDRFGAAQRSAEAALRALLEPRTR